MDPRTTIVASLLKEAVLRWVDSFSQDKLQGIRFLAANPLLLNTVTTTSTDTRVRTSQGQLANELAALLRATAPRKRRPAADGAALHAAVQAATAIDLTDGAIIAAAHRAAIALVDSINSADPIARGPVS